MREARIITLLTGFFIAFCTLPLHADITIRYDQVYQDQQKQPLYSIFIKSNLIRFNHLNGQKSSILINLANGEIVQVHTASKRFFKTDAKTLNQYASFYRDNKTLVQGLIDQGMAQLDSTNRNKVEQLLQGLKKGNANSSSLSVQPTKSIHQVLGVPCHIMAIFDHDQRVRDICLADYQQLELSQSDIYSLEQLKQTIAQFKPSAPKKYQQLLDTLVTGLQKLSGIPLKTVQYAETGKIVNMIQAANISVRNINTETFLIPEEFEQQMFPVL